MKVEFYQASLNPDLVEKEMAQDDPHTLLGSIQLACEIETWEQVVKLLWLQYQAGLRRWSGDSESGEQAWPKSFHSRKGEANEAVMMPEVWGR